MPCASVNSGMSGSLVGRVTRSDHGRSVISLEKLAKSSVCPWPGRIDVRWFGLVFISIAVSLIIVDSTIVNVADPVDRRRPRHHVDQVQWVQEAYTLVFAALLLVFGSLADRFGRRRMLLIGVVIFAAASVRRRARADRRAADPRPLVQGVGGAMILPTTLSIINATFRGRERGIAFAVWGSTIGGMAARRPAARRLADHRLLLAVGVRHQRAARHRHRRSACCSSSPSRASDRDAPIDVVGAAAVGGHERHPRLRPHRGPHLRLVARRRPLHDRRLDLAVRALARPDRLRDRGRRRSSPSSRGAVHRQRRGSSTLLAFSLFSHPVVPQRQHRGAGRLAGRVRHHPRRCRCGCSSCSASTRCRPGFVLLGARRSARSSRAASPGRSSGRVAPVIDRARRHRRRDHRRRRHRRSSSRRIAPWGLARPVPVRLRLRRRARHRAADRRRASDVPVEQSGRAPAPSPRPGRSARPSASRSSAPSCSPPPRPPRAHRSTTTACRPRSATRSCRRWSTAPAARSPDSRHTPTTAEIAEDAKAGVLARHPAGRLHRGRIPDASASLATLSLGSGRSTDEDEASARPTETREARQSSTV